MTTTPGYCELCGTHNYEHQPDCPNTPFNEKAHAFMLTNGFTWQRIAAYWEETGDAENGPDMDGHPAFDEYTDGVCYVFVGENGETGYEVRDIEAEKHFAAMEASFSTKH